MVTSDEFWGDARKDLGIDVRCNATVPELADVGTVDAVVACFGGRAGMIIVDDFDKIREHAKNIITKGYGFTVLSRGATYERESAIEMLRDWGWTCDASPPEWY